MKKKKKKMFWKNFFLFYDITDDTFLKKYFSIKLRKSTQKLLQKMVNKKISMTSVYGLRSLESFVFIHRMMIGFL